MANEQYRKEREITERSRAEREKRRREEENRKKRENRVKEELNRQTVKERNLRTVLGGGVYKGSLR